ncbi:MAG: TIGR04552 family protein [Deltaproteobacteria bacterium]|nr:TIGR04552 family protein [Deltaproteobacteria bacterium]
MEEAGRPSSPPRPAVNVERVRHVLTGGSIVDWPRLDMSTLGEVDPFLRVQEFDVSDPRDMARIRTLRDRAADYLRIEHRYRLPPELVTGDPRDLFLYASGTKGRRNTRSFACMLLKAMHVIHHLEARELGQHLPLSAAEVGQLLDAKVTACVTQMRALGYRIVDFSGGVKSRTSLITKLLAKKDTHSAQVHDRMRYRLVVEIVEDLPVVVDALTQRLLPFNFIVPGQSKNDLVDLSALARDHGVEPADGTAAADQDRPPINEFSGSTYRVVNFVADIPLRVPPEVLAQRGAAEDLGRVIFALCEMQLVDAATARRNEQGENNHEEYKNRQRARVRARLEQGELGRHREGRE